MIASNVTFTKQDGTVGVYTYGRRAFVDWVATHPFETANTTVAKIARNFAEKGVCGKTDAISWKNTCLNAIGMGFIHVRRSAGRRSKATIYVNDRYAKSIGTKTLWEARVNNRLWNDEKNEPYPTYVPGEPLNIRNVPEPVADKNGNGPVIKTGEVEKTKMPYEELMNDKKEEPKEAEPVAGVVEPKPQATSIKASVIEMPSGSKNITLSITLNLNLKDLL